MCLQVGAVLCSACKAHHGLLLCATASGRLPLHWLLPGLTGCMWHSQSNGTFCRLLAKLCVQVVTQVVISKSIAHTAPTAGPDQLAKQNCCKGSEGPFNAPRLVTRLLKQSCQMAGGCAGSESCRQLPHCSRRARFKTLHCSASGLHSHGPWHAACHHSHLHSQSVPGSWPGSLA